MPTPKSDKVMSAVNSVYNVLKPLKPEERRRVLASVRSLLDTSSEIPTEKTGYSAAGQSDALVGERTATARPVAIRELILDKHPHSHPEKITLFAYYREKYENQPNFSRQILKSYYASSHETPPRNFDRDFGHVVRRGWIHEEGENSYITTRGIEAVESGFASGPEIKGHTERKEISKVARKRGKRKSVR